MTEIRLLAMRHSSFYAPLIATVAAGFIEREGLVGQYQVKPRNRNPFEMIERGEVDVMQSAVSSSWARLERGITNLPRHFAQINRRDGFWLLGRAGQDFSWERLEGAVVLADHGPQPLAMLRYAACHQGVDLRKVHWRDAGEPVEIIARWRDGAGDFAHLQGPAPHQLVQEGSWDIVASVGRAIPEVAFSSLAASPSYLESPEGQGFLRAYRQSLRWIDATDAGEIARVLEPFFPGVPPESLASSISDYKSLGCWNLDPSIPQRGYEQALDVFEWNELISKRHAYGEVVTNPW